MTGRCFCGAVAFEFEGPLGDIDICHCTRCQRVTGSAFSAEFRVPAEKFRWVRGEERIASWDAPILREPPAYRSSFCKTCGSPLPSVFAGHPRVAIPAGLVEGEFPVRVAGHIWIAKKASWLDLDEIGRLPKHDTEPS